MHYVENILSQLANSPLLVLTAIAVLAILCGTLRKILVALSRERSRREIAAYIAEGSMSPEQGERLLAAGANDKRCWA